MHPLLDPGQHFVFLFLGSIVDEVVENLELRIIPLKGMQLFDHILGYGQRESHISNIVVDEVLQLIGRIVVKVKLQEFLCEEKARLSTFWEVKLPEQIPDHF